jgi:serine/threonine protein kinase
VRKEEEGTGVLGPMKGFKFEHGEEVCYLFSNDLPTLKLWRDAMSSRLNQRGFHELFKPIKKIGKGNFASVYLAIRLEDEKKFAIKAFSKEATYAEDKGKESLVNEIELMRRFNHKNLMKLFEVYESQNSIYVSVELLEGGQLYDKIKAKHKFSADEIQATIRGLLMGLEHMHERKVMHRDLKPENILLRKEGDFDCVIADFGLSTWADEP